MSNTPNTSRWTVAKYLTEIYIPQKQSLGALTDLSARWYLLIARKLDAFMGDPAKLRELDDETLERFKVWLVKRGYRKKTAIDLRHIVKGILRHWRPEAHPDNSGGLCRQFMEADVTGSLEQLFQERYLPENPRVSSPSTITQYGRCFRVFTEYLGHTGTLADLTDETLGKFMRHRVDAGVCARTANGEAKQLKALWNWAAKKHLIDKFPTVGKLPEPEIVPKAWTREQLQKLIAACGRQEGKIQRAPAADFWTAFHLVLWDTGERTGAMLALEWSMLDDKTGHLTVPAEIRKGRMKAMVYRLKPATLAAVLKLRRYGQDRLFEVADYKYRSWFNVRYKRLIFSAGLPWITRKSGPQKMRRTFASFITAAGGDATAALRHSTRRVTEESYNDPAIANPTPANALLFDLEIVAAKGGPG